MQQQIYAVSDRVTIMNDTRVVRVSGDKFVRDITVRGGDREKVISVSGVFVEIGLIPNTELFRGFVELNAQGEIEVDASMRTSRAGVFAAGDCTSVPGKQIIIAAGDAAKAALAADDHLNRL
jgi:NADH-dependent peroxiredoxin subunit F